MVDNQEDIRKTVSETNKLDDKIEAEQEQE